MYKNNHFTYKTNYNTNIFCKIIEKYNLIFITKNYKLRFFIFYNIFYTFIKIFIREIINITYYFSYFYCINRCNLLYLI